jgi:hypothetical protein
MNRLTKAVETRNGCEYGRPGRLAFETAFKIQRPLGGAARDCDLIQLGDGDIILDCRVGLFN